MEFIDFDLTWRSHTFSLAESSPGCTEFEFWESLESLMKDIVRTAWWHAQNEGQCMIPENFNRVARHSLNWVKTIPIISSFIVWKFSILCQSISLGWPICSPQLCWLAWSGDLCNEIWCFLGHVKEKFLWTP